MRNLFRAAVLAATLAFAAAAAPYAFKPTVTVSVGTSATALAANPLHTFIRVVNNDTSKTLYVSFSSTVTTATGDPIVPGAWLQYIDLVPSQVLYGVTTSGTLDARVTEAFTQ